MFKSLSNFQQRALFGTLGSIIVIAAILASHTSPCQYFFLLLLLIIQAVALWEYYHLTKMKSFQPLSRLAITFSCIYILLHFLTLQSALFSISSELVLYLFGLIAFISYFTRQENAIGNLAVTLFGLLYITLPLSLFLDLNYGLAEQNSPLWLIFLMITTKMTDTCAYFAGKNFGKHQIAPILSPKKTAEGLVGGLVGAVGGSLIFFWIVDTLGFTLMPKISVLECALIALCLGIASVLGDLAESLLKRDAKVKDSSSLPGFGGVLDIVDSTLFTTPLLYLFLRLKVLV